MRMPMTFQNHNPAMLWGRFMPRVKEIKNRVGHAFYSLQKTVPPVLFSEIKPDTPFEKWALVEVSDLKDIPDGMKSFELAAGTYAVFNHIGNTVEGFMQSIHYIIGDWLPDSGYVLDLRPHFEVLGEKYDRFNPNSEEEIWIPVK